MLALLNQPFNIGPLTLANRLIQGPLAGFSCAPFRQQYYQFQPPAYCVSEMISAYDVLYKHQTHSRYLYRAPEEKILCYQLSGIDPFIVSQAAVRLEALGADLIDLNCGCPKTKIRKKGAGSALLERPAELCTIVSAVKKAITIPLTVKLRIQNSEQDVNLVKAIEQAGADALIVHGRRWTDDYDVPSNFQAIALIKQAVSIPVIANGDLANLSTIEQAMMISGCDAYMISRAGSGKPWLYQQLLNGENDTLKVDHKLRVHYFIKHLQDLAELESEYQALLQGKSLVRYYFRDSLTREQLQMFYTLKRLDDVECYLA